MNPRSTRTCDASDCGLPHYAKGLCRLRVQINPSGLCVTCRYCGRCGAIIPLTLKELHDEFHQRVIDCVELAS